MNYSLTQGGNIAVLAGFILLVLKYFGIVIPEQDIINFISAFGVIVGLGMSWYGRYRAGGLHLSGFRK